MARRRLRRPELHPYRSGRLFVTRTLADYPPEAAVDRETCRQFGIRSGLCVPLAVGSEGGRDWSWVEKA